MNKSVPLFLIALFLCVSLVSANNTNTNANGTGNTQPETIVTSTANAGNNSGNLTTGSTTANVTGTVNSTTNQDNETQTNETHIVPGNRNTTARLRIKARTIAEYRQIVQERKQVMNRTLIGLNAKEAKVYRNQNRVREAVHNMLALEDLAGGIGKDISVIARAFNNSVQKTIKAEEKIRKRAPLLRFFAGGDKKASEEIEAELAQNRIRTEKLVQYREKLQPQLKGLLDEQISQIQQEQTRLKELAQKEKKSKGIFGWLWK